MLYIGDNDFHGCFNKIVCITINTKIELVATSTHSSGCGVKIPCSLLGCYCTPSLIQFLLAMTHLLKPHVLICICAMRIPGTCSQGVLVLFPGSLGMG